MPFTHAVPAAVTGVARAHVTGPAPQAVARLLTALDRELSGRRPVAVMYFASSAYDPADVAPVISAHFPRAAVIGCSTAGEFTDLHNGTGGITAVALPDSVITHAAAALGELDGDAGYGTMAAVQELEDTLHIQLRHLDPAHHLGFALIDGLHGSEEQVNDMLGNAAPLLDFVGGSAGDDFAFQGTWTAVGSKVSHHGAALMVCRTAVPFRVVKSCSFTPTGKVLRITRARVSSRTVLEIDGRPAAEAYAEALGVSVDALDVGAWMEYPVGLMIDGRPWIRSPQSVTPDGGLRFFAEIMPGMEVEVMRSGDLIAETAAALRRARAELGGRASGSVLFNCCLRRLEMDAKNLSSAFVAALGGVPSAGFHTYGESWLGHVNQTLTGVVFGTRASRATY
ncbi:FIST signal transduction protein [Streptomyces thermoalcalitolerans]|uniref:FIST N-terminal domain-containing protein n=1 Tax=Streptomyces thermoalcalitolerans TaxID=65605 RepID=A0ABP3YUB3_9ACTN